MLLTVLRERDHFYRDEGLILRLREPENRDLSIIIGQCASPIIITLNRKPTVSLVGVTLSYHKDPTNLPTVLLNDGLEKAAARIVRVFNFGGLVISPMQIVNKLLRLFEASSVEKVVALISMLSTIRLISVFLSEKQVFNIGMVSEFSELLLRTHRNYQKQPIVVVSDVFDLILGVAVCYIKSNSPPPFTGSWYLSCGIQVIRYLHSRLFVSDLSRTKSLEERLTQTEDVTPTIDPASVINIYNQNIRSYQVMNLQTIPEALHEDPWLPRDYQTDLPIRFPIEVEVQGREGKFLMERSRAIAVLGTLRKGQSQHPTIKVTNLLPIKAINRIYSRLKELEMALSKLELENRQNHSNVVKILHQAIVTSGRLLLDKGSQVDEKQDTAWNGLAQEPTVIGKVRAGSKWCVLSVPHAVSNTITTAAIVIYDYVSSFFTGRREALELLYPDQLNSRRFVKDGTLSIIVCLVLWKLYRQLGILSR